VKKKKGEKGKNVLCGHGASGWSNIYVTTF